ncbi:MAG: hypothetical protein H7Z19_20290 [Chitinophagaceae bacterium]|nr:hypothetical protein [Rubrivivax sp.]
MPNADPGLEPLALTVHEMPSPDVDDERRRTARGRLKMLFVLLVCAAPVVASYLMYFVIRPEGRNNYGTLILPTRPLPSLALRTLEGAAVPAATLKGQWLLVAVGPGACDGGCEKRLFTQRQLREMLGRERDRLDKVWFVTGEQAPSVTLQAGVTALPGMIILRADRAALAAWLAPGPGLAIEDHLYLVDPLGEWMLRLPVELDPAKAKRDLERLLRASASWDQPGR